MVADKASPTRGSGRSLGAPGRKGADHVGCVSITPLGGSESVGEQVAEAVRIVRASGLASETNAMFTNVEGECDEIMPVIRACLDKVAETAPRVTAIIKVDRRPGAPGDRLRSDVESLERRLR